MIQQVMTNPGEIIFREVDVPRIVTKNIITYFLKKVQVASGKVDR